MNRNYFFTGLMPVIACVCIFLCFSTPLTLQATRTQTEVSDTNLRVVVDVKPTFKQDLNQWLADNVKYPEEAFAGKIEGLVLVSFIVELDGSLSQVRVARSVHPLLDEEALRVVKSMPEWQPAKFELKECRYLVTLPIRFKYTSSEPTLTYVDYLQDLIAEKELLRKGQLLTSEQQAERVDLFKKNIGDDETVYKMLLEKSRSIQKGIDSLIQAQSKVLMLKDSEVKTLTKIYQKEIATKIKFFEELGSTDFIRKFVANEYKVRAIEMEKITKMKELLDDRFRLYFENYVLSKRQ